MNLELLFLHSSGLGWDEALVVLGGLAILTLVLLTRLRSSEPAGDPEPVRQRKR